MTIALGLCASRGAVAQTGADSCVVSVLNRNAQVRTDGTWVLPNIPANLGPVRARVTCVVDGKTITGESDPFVVPANGTVKAPRIHFGQRTPIPTSLTVTAVSDTLTQVSDALQLAVAARYSDGSTKDVSGASNGTIYRVSNPAFATISADGLVQAVASGTVIIQARLEGAAGMIALRVAFSGGDSDGDGIPDDVELSSGMNPNNSTDGAEDFDRDGLTNLQEYQLGTDARKADTDGDGLTDGQELARGTSPLVRDTDGDGISDGLEVQTGSNPRDPDDFNLAGALKGIAITPPLFTLTFNTIAGDVSVQLRVTGTLLDGSALDLTSKRRVGQPVTDYTSSDAAVCSFSTTRGQVFAGTTGTCVIIASVGAFTSTANGTVNTFSPIPLSVVALAGPGNSVDVDRDFAFVAVGNAGLQVVDISDRSALRITASLTLPGTANDVRLVGNRAYVAAGGAGLHIVDVSNPLAPRLIGSVDTPGSANDVSVRGSLAFVADGPAGLHVVDTTSAQAPRIIGSVATAEPANGVDVTETLAIVALGSTGIQVVDVSNPTRPVALGTVDTPGEARDVVVKGSIAYVADYTGSLRAVDFTTPTAPVLRGTTPPDLGGMLLDVATMDSFVFGADVFFVNGVPIVEVSDPDNLRPRAILNFPGDATGTGVAVDGSYVYLGTDTAQLYIGQYRIQQDLNGVPPEVSVVSPAPGTTFLEGETIPMTVVATDDFAVTGVSFMVDGTPVATDTTAPYQYNVTARVGAAIMTLGARAGDLGNNTGTAEDVQVNVIPDPLTTVVGRVVGASQEPLAGVTANVLGHTATTDQSGSFSIAGVSTLPRALIVGVTDTEGGATRAGIAPPTPPVRGGVTDVGDIVLSSVTFVGDLGAPFAGACSPDNTDNCAATSLPFAFPFDGTTYQQLYVNASGYVSLADPATLSISPLAAFVAEDGFGSIFVNDKLPDRFVVTWTRQAVAGRRSDTIQMILFANGTIQFGYKGVATKEGRVGIFPLNPFTNTAVDFSAGATFTTVAGEALYEEFETSANPFDLDGGFVTFTPNSAGGYEILLIPDPLTTVVGRVLTRSAATGEPEPLSGATVRVLGRTGTTGSDGVFSISAVPTAADTVTATAISAQDGIFVSGLSAATSPIRGGTTNVGDIIVAPVGGSVFETELGERVSQDCSLCTVPFPFLFGSAGSPTVQFYRHVAYAFFDRGPALELFACCHGNLFYDDENDPTSGVYINDRLPGRLVITWFRQTTGYYTNTIQLVLFADGRIQYGYHGVAYPSFARVALVPFDAAVQTSVNFSSRSTFTMSPREEIAELFDEDNPFDLDESFVVFVLDAAGGYAVRHLPDTVLPACTMTNPADGSTLFEGEALAVQATAGDNLGVDRVVFQSSDGSLTVEDTSAPYEGGFVVPVGATRLTFTTAVYDRVGNSASCSSAVDVIAGPPPTLTIVSPAPGGVVTEGSTIPVIVDATNRVPVSRVDLIVNGVPLSTDVAPPYEFLFTVPAGVSSVTMAASAVNSVGNSGTSDEVSVTVTPDRLTVVQGRTIDAFDTPISGADVVAELHGVSAEVFNFDTPLVSLPDLTGKDPDRALIVSAVNLRNPAGVFGSDPFGFGPSLSHAARFSGTLQTTVAGTYTFTLGVNQGGRLIVNGSAVVDLPNGTGEFQEASATITVDRGSVPIQILTFDNGNPEVRLSYAPPERDSEVVPPDMLMPAVVPYQATSVGNGTFSIAVVPTALGNVGASATLLTSDGSVSTGKATPASPVAGGTTDVGDIVVTSLAFEINFGTLVAQCDTCSVRSTLPFAFPFYGSSDENIFVNNRGNVTFEFPDNSYGGFFGPIPIVAPFFAYLYAPMPSGDAEPGLYVNDTLPERFVVTWLAQFDGDDSGPNTIQLILFSDGRIQFGYRGVAARNAIVGLTPGGLSPGDPRTREVDFNGGGTTTTSAGEAVYEPFGFYDASGADKAFDLDRGLVVFTPNAAGGYDIRHVPDRTR